MIDLLVLVVLLPWANLAGVLLVAVCFGVVALWRNKARGRRDHEAGRATR